MSQSSSPRKFLMKERKLTVLLEDLVWGAGVPVQQDIMDTVQRYVSKGILKQITSMCLPTLPQNDAAMQAMWILYYELFFHTGSRGLDLTERDVNQMCTWDETALGRDFWEHIHHYGDRP